MAAEFMASSNSSCQDSSVRDPLNLSDKDKLVRSPPPRPAPSSPGVQGLTFPAQDFVPSSQGGHLDRAVAPSLVPQPPKPLEATTASDSGQSRGTGPWGAQEEAAPGGGGLCQQVSTETRTVKVSGQWIVRVRQGCRGQSQGHAHPGSPSATLLCSWCDSANNSVLRCLRGTCMQ